jgi:hypothetical protein
VDVTFFSADSTLRLDASALFTGLIKGFADENSVDFADIVFSGATTVKYQSDLGDGAGTLTVSDGAHTANVRFDGAHSLADFQASSDGHGGTLITDPLGGGGGGALARMPATAAPIHVTPDAFHFAAAPDQDAPSLFVSNMDLEDEIALDLAAFDQVLQSGDGAGPVADDADHAIVPPPETTVHSSAHNFY